MGPCHIHHSDWTGRKDVGSVAVKDMLLRRLRHSTDDDSVSCHECGLILEAIERWKPGWLRDNAQNAEGFASVKVYRYHGGKLDGVNLEFVENVPSDRSSEVRFVKEVGSLYVIRRPTGMF